MLRQAVAEGASDLHLHAGAPLRVRVGGVLRVLGEDVYDVDRVQRLVLAALTETEREQFGDRGEIDICHTFEGIGRFRSNVFRQQRGVDGVFRYIPAAPPTL